MARTVREVAAGVFVTTAARDLTTTTILVHGSQALLVDPAWDPHELDGLADWLHGQQLTVVAGFATHAHHDHVLWHPRFGTGPRWASEVTAARASQHRDQLVDNLGPSWPLELKPLVGRLTPINSHTLPWPTEIVLITHDAHTPGHTALWLPEPRILIAGDMLSDVEPPLPEETGPAEYLDGLTLLEPYVEQAALVIPGHGHPGVDGAARWQHDVDAIGRC